MITFLLQASTMDMIPDTVLRIISWSPCLTASAKLTSCEKPT
ncbi:unnamed protein product [Acanthoscelides obtectus]|uniref:Uncharacterized protein n=1 Tax=Acanthoscelides obtectus TaxID=200917 RepID=A0A9P0LK83_ACAOB|nr:unnamed protein product [Acanthoscelides obtectus]CAK1681989.1 hypothetical protein AOBTE_LOCUS33366 [Acanthoscelides obtectus]